MTQGVIRSPSVGHYKDVVLDRIAERANVAQFVSFSPRLEHRFVRIRGLSPDHPFPSPRTALEALFGVTPEGRVNVRSYDPQQPKSREFLYGLSDLDEAVGAVTRLAAEGLYTIVNETIDVHDGGVSGVAYGDVVEFAPEDTPRCVEQPGTATLPRSVGLKMLQTVYGFAPTLPDTAELRVEFSLHPLRRGLRHDHTIIWETEDVGHPPDNVEITWPNRFSRFLGDKLFGLLVADAVGVDVPRTVVMGRNVAPFVFGQETGSGEVWIRTCPTEQVPGRYTTRRGWIDPFRLLQEEDPSGAKIPSVLSQEGVEAHYSGALLPQLGTAPLVEGVLGPGDEFMIGRRGPERLPAEVIEAIRQTYATLAQGLGPVRFEWVHDGTRPWVVQLHRGHEVARGRMILPGEAEKFHRFDVSRGLEVLRQLVGVVQGTGEGIILVGEVGVTSHLGDILRRARIPSWIEHSTGESV